MGFAPPERTDRGGLALIYGVLFRPRDTFWEIPLDRSLGRGVLVLVLVAAINAFASEVRGIGMLLLAFATWLGWMTLGWLVLTAVLFVVTHLLRPTGKFTDLLAATSLSFLPLILEGPLHVVSRWGNGGLTVAAIGTVAVFIWFFRVLLAGVRGATGLTSAQAVTALVLSELVLVGVPLLFMTLATLMIVVLIGGS